jgi:hypothetical protein
MKLICSSISPNIRRLTDEYTTTYIHWLTDKDTGLCIPRLAPYIHWLTDEYTTMYIHQLTDKDTGLCISRFRYRGIYHDYIPRIKEYNSTEECTLFSCSAGNLVSRHEAKAQLLCEAYKTRLGTSEISHMYFDL